MRGFLVHLTVFVVEIVGLAALVPIMDQGLRKRPKSPRTLPIIAGLIIGGVIAAPFAAIATKHIPDKVLMLLVGCVVVLLSLRTILLALAPGP